MRRSTGLDRKLSNLLELLRDYDPEIQAQGLALAQTLEIDEVRRLFRVLNREARSATHFHDVQLLWLRKLTGAG